MSLFDLGKTPLHSGKMLIEASAGTGKTYSLTHMILRLLAEENLTIDQILVVTYTEAATAELKHRTHRAIARLLEQLESPSKPTDPLARELWKCPGRTEPGGPVDRLRRALGNFDRASIFTIHGFCARMLVEYAFESNSLFDSEVLPNDEDLLREIANDYWRMNLYGLTSTEEIQAQIAGLQSPWHLHNELSGCIDMWQIYKGDDFKRQAGKVIDRFVECAQKQRDALCEAIETKGNFDGRKINTNPQFNPVTLLQACDEPDSFGAQMDFLHQHVSALEKILPYRIEAAAKNFIPRKDDHKLFKAAADAYDLIKSNPKFPYSPRLRRFVAWAEERLRVVKLQRNVITFQDMLTRMRDAVNSSTPLLTALTSRYKAALIDEFQDTDGIQLAIFQKIFSSPKHRLYCVGDPKQSIYEFRGADIDTFLQASRGKDFKKYSLFINYRSDEAIVRAVNYLFTKSPDLPFGEEISFLEAAAAAQQPAKLSGDLNPFCFCNVGSDPNDLDVANAVVAQARRIVDSFETFTYSSVAVLVNSHVEARAISTALSAARIPSVRRVDQSVFSTHAAIALKIALAGILDASSVPNIKAALATPLFGVEADELRRLDEDDDALNAWFETFHELRSRWHQSGFTSCFQLLITQHGIRHRLLSEPNGEEPLSLFLHLGELMHEHERNVHCSPLGLLQWLSENIAGTNGPPGDADKIRRSTDADAVVISTIHSSKGLQYDAVVVPFAWKATDGNHENMRKLYVALTRAKHHCTVFVANVASPSKTRDSCALARLLGGQIQELVATAHGVAEDSSGTITFEDNTLQRDEKPLPADATSEKLQPRRPLPQIPYPLLTNSYSAMTGDAIHRATSEAIEDPNADCADEEATPLGGGSPSQPTQDPLPLGARTGTALHAMMERLDFAKPQNLKTLIEEELSREGLLQKETADRLMELFPGWLSTPLNADGSLRLNQITNGQRINELEFCFPLQRVHPKSLAEAVAPEQDPELCDALGAMQLHAPHGYMKGFIDLVFSHEQKFYIIDWKSNYLADDPQGYGADQIRASMLESLYFLQYLIYSVALDTYLKDRLPDYSYDAHFGGVYYVYLRGFGTAAGHSVYFRKPAAETIHNLKKCLTREPCEPSVPMGGVSQ